MFLSPAPREQSVRTVTAPRSQRVHTPGAQESSPALVADPPVASRDGARSGPLRNRSQASTSSCLATGKIFSLATKVPVPHAIPDLSGISVILSRFRPVGLSAVWSPQDLGRNRGEKAFQPGVRFGGESVREDWDGIYIGLVLNVLYQRRFLSVVQLIK